MEKQTKLNTAQELIAVEDIKDDLLYSESGYIFNYLWVRTKDANLFSEDEQISFYKNISIALEIEKLPWQLISLPRVVDTHDLIENLLKLRKAARTTAKINLLNSEIFAVQEMARNGLKEPLIFIKIWQRKGKKAEAELKKRQSDLVTRLSERKVTASSFLSSDITYICKLFAELGQHHSKENDETDYSKMPIIKQKKFKDAALKELDTIRREKINLITPCGSIAFKTNKIIIGSMTARAYFANLFPSQLDFAWAVKMMNCTEAVTCITFNLSNSNQLADALSRSIKQNSREATEAIDAREQKTRTRAAEDADRLISKLDEAGEAIGQMSLVVMPFSADEDELDETCRRVTSAFSVNRIKLRLLGQLQKQGFKTISPYHVPDEKIMDMTLRMMPLTTLIGGSPMTINTLKDDNGFYFAKTDDGGIISINFSKRGGDRTNANIIITGKPGTGKSTAIKHIIEILYMAGWKILIIDPESEYKDLCRNLDGAWLDAGGGKAKSNVLQVRSAPLDDDDETNPMYQADEKPLAQHMKTLDTFFCTYLPSLTDLQKALLKRALTELYEKFGITWDTDVSAFKNTDFPIFSDLYALLQDKSKEEKKYEDIASLFYDIAMGADSFLWNGHTNINVDNDFVCFDTNKLAEASDRIKSTQYFNLLTQAWQLMSENREEPTILICDEAYLLVDPTVPQSLMYLRNISKRCRKYAGALAVISHSLVDFLDERVRMYSQALLENPTYKLFFGTDGQNLKETAALYNLSDSEQGILQAGIQREALAFIGSQRVKVRFDLPDYKIKLMGKGGGL